MTLFLITYFTISLAINSYVMAVLYKTDRKDRSAIGLRAIDCTATTTAAIAFFVVFLFIPFLALHACFCQKS